MDQSMHIEPLSPVGAVISGLDFHIGRLLAAVKELHLDSNTIIIYSADHGLALGSHGLMEKQSLYDDAMKPPLIFCGPGISIGRSDALVYLLDIFPTVCELAGARIPAGLDGKSFAGILQGRRGGTRDSLFLAYRDVQRAIRDERWKLIHYPQINRTQLFDLRADPGEMQNLASDPRQSARLDQLTARLREWQKNLGDTLSLTAEHPKTPAFNPPSPSGPKPPKNGKPGN